MRVVAWALVALLLAPGAVAATPPPEFPDNLNALLGRWIESGSSLITAEDREQPWFNGTNTFLERAREADAEGRLREGMFHLETFHELLFTKRMMDEAGKLGNDGERRVFAVQQLRPIQSDAKAAWTSYRAQLHGYDGELHSLHTIEQVLYSTDIAIGGVVNTVGFDTIAEDLSKRRDFPEGHVYGLVRSSSTPLLNIEWAADILSEATKHEGLPPRIIDAQWANLTASGLASGSRGAPGLEGLEELADPVRANNESMLAFGFLLAKQRIQRVTAMETIFGDATSRKDVLDDAGRFMAAAANNTTLAAPRSVGLLGVFTSDALDRVLLTQEYLANGTASLSIVLLAWASLDHAGYATNALTLVSPVSPPVAPENEAPGLAGWALLAALGAVALVRRRAR